MQSVGTMIRRPVPFGTAAATGLLAFAAGAAIAVSAPALTTGSSASHGPGATASTGIVGAEQVGHNRSEEGLADVSSIGGQQIAHNRSEEGLADR
jgi:hypothetical protein